MGRKRGTRYLDDGSSVRILTVFAATISLVGGLMGATLLLEAGEHPGWAALAGIAGIGGCLWLSRLDDRLKRDVDSSRAHLADERFMQLLVAARADDFELEVKGASNAWLALLALMMGATALLVLPDANGIERVAGWFAVGIMIPAGMLLFLMSLPQIGKPVITLTRSGFRTATSPEIAWRLVGGVRYSESSINRNDSEAEPVGSLVFNIPAIKYELPQFTLVSRFVHGFWGNRSLTGITIDLRKTSEPPSAVGRLAQYLWSQNTGRTNDGSRQMSATPANVKAEIEALRAQMERARDRNLRLSAEIQRESRRMWRDLVLKFGMVISVLVALVVGLSFL